MNKFEGQSCGISIAKPERRITFSNLYEMDSITASLDEIPYAEQKAWSKSHLLNSSLEKGSAIKMVDPSYYTRLNSFKAILNSDLEFQINDSIMWYNNDVVYYLGSSKSGVDLDQLKMNPQALDVYYKYEFVSLDDDNQMSRAAEDLILNGGFISGEQEGKTSSKTITVGAFTLTPSQLRNFEYATEVIEGDYPKEEIYSDHQLKFKLYCERREKGGMLVSGKMETYKIYIKVLVYKRMSRKGVINSYLIFPNGEGYQGNFKFESPISYTVTRNYKGGMQSARPETYAGKENRNINVDLSTISDEIFIYQTGDGYGSLEWNYRSYNFKIELVNLAGYFSFPGIGAAAPKIQFSDLN